MAWLQRRIGNRALSPLGRTQAMPPATATRSNAIDGSSRHTTSTDCRGGIAKRPDSMLPAIREIVRIDKSRRGGTKAACFAVMGCD